MHDDGHGISVVNAIANSDPFSLGEGYDGLVAYLRDGNVTPTALSPKRFCAVLNLDVQTLADLAHVHRNTLTRAPDSETIQRFLREVLRVLCAAFDVSNDMSKAVFWYRNEPIAAFKYKTAERLVSEGRTDDVVRYVTSLATGATD